MEAITFDGGDILGAILGVSLEKPKHIFKMGVKKLTCGFAFLKAAEMFTDSKCTSKSSNVD